MPTLTNLVVNMTGDSSDLNRTIDQVKKRLRSLGKGMKDAGKKAALVGGVLGGAVAGGLIALGKTAANNIDKTNKMATSFGATGDQIELLRLAGEKGGVGLGAIEKGIRTATRRLAEFSQGRGGKKLAQSMKDMGVSSKFAASLIEQGAVPAFANMLKIIGEMEPGAKRTNAAMNLLTKGGAALIPVGEEMARNWEQNQKFIRFWRGETDKLSPNIEDMNDQMGLTGTVLRLIGERFVTEFATPIANAATSVRNMIGEFIKAQGGIDNFVNTSMQAMIGSMDTFLEKAQEVIGVIKIMAGWIKSVGDFLTGAGTGIGKVLEAGGGRQAAGLSPGLGANQEMVKKQETQNELQRENNRILKEKLGRAGFGPEAIGGFGP